MDGNPHAVDLSGAAQRAAVLPLHTQVEWAYRSATGYGEVSGYATKGADHDHTKYRLHVYYRHRSADSTLEPATREHWGTNVHRQPQAAAKARADYERYKGTAQEGVLSIPAGRAVCQAPGLPFDTPAADAARMNATHSPAGSSLTREFQITREAVNAEARTVTLAFASETPVPRMFGNEVLDLQPQSVRLDRLRRGGALLLQHDSDRQVGVIESVAIDPDRVGRAVVRFGKSAAADEVFTDVVDGIRRNVSVGYQIHDAKLEGTRDGVDTYRVTDWEPFEISIVSVPADTSVGVGRAREATATPSNRTEPMNEEGKQPAAPAPAAARTAEPATPAAPVDLAAVRAGALKDERQRVADIKKFGYALRGHGGVEAAQAAVDAGLSFEEFRDKLYAKIDKEPKLDAAIGMNDREAGQYSFVRALNALANPTDMRAREAAAFEFEASRAAADKQRREVKGLLVPADVLRRGIRSALTTRASNDLVGTATAGGNLVATDLLSASFIDMLRNAMVIDRLGTLFLNGLVGNIAIPKQSGGATFYWLAEDASVAGSGQTVAQVSMKPHTGAAKTQISRKLLTQSSIDVEAFVRQDLSTTVGLGIQQAAINGDGTGNAPTGILSTSGIGSVEGGTNGAKPTWANVIALESAVSAANADVGTLAYLTNAKVRGILKATQRFTNGGDAIWDDGATPLNGYAAGVTNAVPSDGTKGTGTALSSFIFGNFADLVIGLWGGLELQVDPYSAGDSGAVIVRAFQDVDVAVRHAESFAAMTDALTA